jgi:SAM-dependent methyltransferase
MHTLAARWQAFLDRQHQHPVGLAGAVVGEKMARQHAPETGWTRDLLAIRADDAVLEVGCGAGRGLRLVAEQAVRGCVVGLDLSATMLAAAARRNRGAVRSGRLALLRGDLQALPLAERRFDKIFSIHTFYFWPEPLATVDNLLRLLAPGGLLVVTLATGTVTPRGEDVYWPLHQQVEALVEQLQTQPLASAALLRGPNSRRYNNVAIIVRR